MIGVLQKYIKNGEAIVFGSHATDPDTERSDIDIALRNIDFFPPYALSDLADEIAELDFPYLADVLIYEEIADPALKEYIDRMGVVFVKTNRVSRLICYHGTNLNSANQYLSGCPVVLSQCGEIDQHYRDLWLGDGFYVFNNDFIYKYRFKCS